MLAGDLKVVMRALLKIIRNTEYDLFVYMYFLKLGTFEVFV